MAERQGLSGADGAAPGDGGLGTVDAASLARALTQGVVDRMKEAYGAKTDISLAARLGVHFTTVSSWRRRGAVPAKYVIACGVGTGVDQGWLFSGRHEPDLIVREAAATMLGWPSAAQKRAVADRLREFIGARWSSMLVASEEMRWPLFHLNLCCEGQRLPDVEDLAALAEHGCDVSWLLRGVLSGPKIREKAANALLFAEVDRYRPGRDGPRVTLLFPNRSDARYLVDTVRHIRREFWK